MTVDHAEAPKSSGLFGVFSRLFRQAPATQEGSESQDGDAAHTHNQVAAPSDVAERKSQDLSAGTATKPGATSMQASTNSAFGYPAQPSWPNLTTESLSNLKATSHRRDGAPVTDAYQACIDNCDPNATLAEYLREKGPQNLSGVEAATVLNLICKAVDKGESLVDFDNVLDRSYSMRQDSMRGSRSMRSLHPRRHRRRLIPRSSEISVGDSLSEYPSQSLLSDSFWNTSKRKWAPIDDDLSYAQLSERGGAMTPRDHDGQRPAKRSATMSSMASHVTQTAARPAVDTTMAINDQSSSGSEPPANDIPMEKDESATDLTSAPAQASKPAPKAKSVLESEPLPAASNVQINGSSPSFTRPEGHIPALPAFPLVSSEMKPLARSSIMLSASKPKTTVAPALPRTVDEASMKFTTPAATKASPDEIKNSVASSNTNAFTCAQPKRVVYEVEDISDDQEDTQEGASNAVAPKSDLNPAHSAPKSMPSLFAPVQQASEPQKHTVETITTLQKPDVPSTKIFGTSAKETPKLSPSGPTSAFRFEKPEVVIKPSAPLAEKPAEKPVAPAMSPVPAPIKADEKLDVPEKKVSSHREQDSDVMDIELFDAQFDAAPKGHASVLSSNLEGEIAQIEVEYDFS